VWDGCVCVCVAVAVAVWLRGCVAVCGVVKCVCMCGLSCMFVMPWTAHTSVGCREGGVERDVGGCQAQLAALVEAVRMGNSCWRGMHHRLVHETQPHLDHGLAHAQGTARTRSRGRPSLQHGGRSRSFCWVTAGRCLMLVVQTYACSAIRDGSGRC